MDQTEYYQIFINEQDHFWYRANRDFSLKLIDYYCKLPLKARILDVGCGTGGTTVFLKKYGSATGVDVSQNALKLAKKYDIGLEIGDANSLPFEKNAFDLVTCFDVLYHQKVIVDQAINEIWRVLRPGGWALIRVPAFEFLRGGHDVVVHTQKRFTTAETQVFLQKFKIHKLTYFNMSLFLPALLWRSNNKKTVSDVTPVWPPLNFLLYNLLMLESKLATVLDLPFGTSVYVLAQKI